MFFMKLEESVVEIDGKLVGELKKPSEDTFVFIPENFEEKPDFRNLNSDNEILIEGRKVSYEEFKGVVRNCFVTTKEEYFNLWVKGDAYSGKGVVY